MKAIYLKIHYFKLTLRRVAGKTRLWIYSQLFKKSCDLGEGAGCNNLGILYADGKGVSQDDTKASELYKKSCDLGSADGCKNFKNSMLILTAKLLFKSKNK